MTLYKIKNIDTNEYSLGGSYPRFSPVGKFWKLQSLKSHFTLVKKQLGNLQSYAGCVIEEYEVTKTKNLDFVINFAEGKQND